jgi:monoamine oxidase
MGAAPPDYDVAVVGAGISGVYTAWRLLTGQPAHDSDVARWRGDGRLKVALFEQSDRIGGRLLSARPPGLPDTTAELGGMRYVSTQHRVAALVEKVFRLRHHQQIVEEDNNIGFLRGRLLRMSQLRDPLALPYYLDPGEAAWLAAGRGKSPADLIGRALTRLMPDINERQKDGTLGDYLSAVKLAHFPGEGRAKLWQHGFWNLLAKEMSPDGYAAARATIGYDSLQGNSNALDMTREAFAFAPGVEYRMVDQGYELLPWKLAEAFKEAGGTIKKKRSLTYFDANDTAGVKLAFDNGLAPVTARAVVLAMPRRSLELLQGPKGRWKTFQSTLAAVMSVPLFKLFLLYDECWWQDAGVTRGRSLTDLPLRQCYYWPVGRSGGCVPGRSDKGLVMAYDDLRNVSFWNGLRKPAPPHEDDSDHWQPLNRDSVSQLSPGGSYDDQLTANWCERRATTAMALELHRQLMVMHGAVKAPNPIDAAYMDWSEDPYGGGVHFWNPGINSAECVLSMTEPMQGFPCYLCGEAYSTEQTWVEGALETAEIVLQKRLGLQKPGWLPA